MIQHTAGSYLRCFDTEILPKVDLYYCHFRKVKVTIKFLRQGHGSPILKNKILANKILANKILKNIILEIKIIKNEILKNKILNNKILKNKIFKNIR